MIEKIWSCDKCHTFKSCAGVFLITAIVAGFLIMVRLVGEKRLQRFLDFVFWFKRREPRIDLVSESFVPENKI